MMRRRLVTIAYLQAVDDGPSLTPYDIARISEVTLHPVSHETVRRDIDRGNVLGAKRQRGQCYEFRIAWVEARRYLAVKCGPARNVSRETTTQSTQTHTPSNSNPANLLMGSKISPVRTLT